jgi:hypothetical protein
MRYASGQYKLDPYENGMAALALADSDNRRKLESFCVICATIVFAGQVGSSLSERIKANRHHTINIIYKPNVFITEN